MTRMAALAALALVALAAPAQASSAGSTTQCKYGTRQTPPANGQPGTQSGTWCLAPPAAFPAYKGSAAYFDDHCGWFPFNANLACTANFVQHPIWERTATGWTPRQIGEGTQIYIHPWTPGWRWVYYTQPETLAGTRIGSLKTGWYAAREQDLVLYWKAS